MTGILLCTLRHQDCFYSNPELCLARTHSCFHRCDLRSNLKPFPLILRLLFSFLFQECKGSSLHCLDSTFHTILCDRLLLLMKQSWSLLWCHFCKHLLWLIRCRCLCFSVCIFRRRSIKVLLLCYFLRLENSLLLLRYL